MWMLLAASVFIGSDIAASQQLAKPHHEQVLASIIERTASFELPDRVEIVVEQHTPPSAITENALADLQRLAPVDTTARLRLEQYQREYENGGVNRTLRLMYAGADQWRLNRDRVPQLVVDYTDAATNGRKKWLLTNRTLQFAGHSDRVEQFAIESGPGMIGLWLAIMSTGFALPTEASYELLSVSSAPDGGLLYTINSSLAKTYRLTVEEHAVPEQARVTLVEYARSESSEHFVPAARITGWRWNDSIGGMIAHSYEMITSGGVSESTILLKAMVPLDRDMADVTALPEADGVDPFRGNATFASVVDLTRGRTQSIDASSRAVTETIRTARRTNPFLSVSAALACLAGAVIVVTLIRNQRK